MQMLVKNLEMTVKTMSVDDWCDDRKCRPCPIQRDTAAHATRFNRRGGHLAEAHMSHQRVSMAVTKKGVKYKLDGHSRGYLWKRGLLDAPINLTVDVYRVEAVQDVMDLYKVFDSDTAVENTGDKIMGAFSYHKFNPRHRALFSTSTVSAMRVLVFPSRFGDDKVLSIYDLVEPWIPTFRILDSLEPFSNSRYFPSPVKAAMMMTVLRDKNKALSFWQAFHDEDISRTKVSKDGMYASRELTDVWLSDPINHMRGYGGIRKYAPIYVYFYDQWSRGKRIPTDLRYLNQKWQKDLSPLTETWKDEIGDYFYPQIRNGQK